MSLLKKKVVLHLRGGLGNQLFQFAAAHNYASRSGRKLVIDFSYVAKKGRLGYTLTQQAKPDILELLGKNDIDWKSSGLRYQVNERLISGLSPSIKKFNCLISEDNYLQLININLKRPQFIRGYFESQHFAGEAEIIDEIIKKIRNYMITRNRKDDPPFIAIHVRLGDLVEQKRVHIPSLSYYLNSLEMLRNNLGISHAIVFTDKPQEAYTQYRELFSQKEVTMAQIGSACEHLSLMSQSNGIICSNSTLSWWAARAVEKIENVIDPNNYFHQGHYDKTMKYPFWPKEYNKQGDSRE